MEKGKHNQEISVPSASTPVAREISGDSKDGLSPDDVRPFQKPGPRCDRRQRKKVDLMLYRLCIAINCTARQTRCTFYMCLF